MNDDAIDLDRLLKLRLVVARFGEMDLAKWWNTKGELGRLGAAALRCGFPRTHHFAQARSVFAVAAHRCAEVFEPSGCVTLWRLDGKLNCPGKPLLGAICPLRGTAGEQDGRNRVTIS